MKLYSRVIFCLFFNCFLMNHGYSQDSYVLLKDPSGLGPSAYEKIELEEAADSLVAKFPILKRDSFKVIEGAIYPIMNSTAEGINESLEIQKKGAVVFNYIL